MTNLSRLLSSVVFVALFVCCGETTEPDPPPTYENVAGTYNGTFTSTGHGNDLDGTLEITIGQNEGALSGSYTFEGSLDDGASVDTFRSPGTFNGTVQVGENPSLSISLHVNMCANHSSTYRTVFTGSFSSTNGQITITGSLEFMSMNCSSVIQSYPATIVLGR